MIFLAGNIQIPDDEIEMTPIRAQGHGGQNVNKVSTAIHLRFDILHSSLPDIVKQKLLHHADHRISKQGVIIIKSQNSRSQDKNRQDAIQRLRELIIEATRPVKKRVATKPTRASIKRRLEKKLKQSEKKSSRKKVTPDG